MNVVVQNLKGGDLFDGCIS